MVSMKKERDVNVEKRKRLEVENMESQKGVISKKASVGYAVYFLVVSRFISPCIEFMNNLKFRLLVKKMEWSDRIIRNTHCSKGFHKTGRNTFTYCNPKMKKYFKIEYLTCRFCGYTFFATKKEHDVFYALTGNSRCKRKEAEKFLKIRDGKNNYE